MKPKVKITIVRPELPQSTLEALLKVREFFQDKIHIDLSFYRHEYQEYLWSMDYINPGNRLTAQWKRDNLSVFNSDIIIICIPKNKWMRKGAGGYSPDHEQKEMIILKDTNNIEWLTYAAIHELLHTFCDLTEQKDILHSYDTGSKGANGLDDMLPMLDYIDWDKLS